MVNNSVTTTWREQLWLPIKVLHFQSSNPQTNYIGTNSKAPCAIMSLAALDLGYNKYKGHRVVYEGLVPLLEPPTSITPAYTRTYVHTCIRTYTHTTHTHTHVNYTIDCSGCHCHVT